MKRVFALTAGAVLAAAFAAAPVSAADSAQSEVQKANEAVDQALQVCDVKTEGKYMSDNKFARWGHSDGATDTRTQWLASLERCAAAAAKDPGLIAQRSYKSDTPDIVAVGDMAVVFGTLRYKTTSSGGNAGTVREGSLFYTRTFVKEKGMWRMLSHQGVDPPKK